MTKDQTKENTKKTILELHNATYISTKENKENSYIHIHLYWVVTVTVSILWR